MGVTTTGSRRAAALPPDERRAAIVAAALPLLLERGAKMTTRMVAEAAGVAEGTIFRVFPDKDALVAAVIDAAIDGSSVEASIAAIDRTLPFEDQLVAAVGLIQHRVVEVWRLLSAVDDPRFLHGRKHRPMEEPAALIALFEAQAANLRIDPTMAARALRSLTLAATHPILNPSGAMDAGEIVALVLDGIRSRPEAHGCS